MDDARRQAPAVARNLEPILAVLEDWLPAQGRVLEFGSGSGEHVCAFAKRWQGLAFQPSDPTPAARESVAEWTRVLGLANVAAPLALSTEDEVWPAADVVIAINVIHISPWRSTEALLAGVARQPGAWLYVYGPFRRGGEHTSQSNADFDASLRSRNPDWGVRDLEAIAQEAARHGLALDTPIAMPANNWSIAIRPARPTP